MLTVNITHVLILISYEHVMLFLLEWLFQEFHQYAQYWGSLISFIHASFVEQRLVFWSKFTKMAIAWFLCIGSNQCMKWLILNSTLNISYLFTQIDQMNPKQGTTALSLDTERDYIIRYNLSMKYSPSKKYNISVKQDLPIKYNIFK